ncbi:MAG: MATE family efflux transporter [Clostridia bacterium]|nr:MATE family efflux transporter [Clostridia bacterium]
MSVSKTEKRSRVLDMTKGSILKNLLLFAGPLAATSVLQLLFNAADMVVVGQFSPDSSTAVGAIGATGTLINLFINFFMGLSIGATVLIARYFGAGREKDMSETVHTAVLVSIISGIIMTVLGILFANTMLSMMNTQPEHFPLSSRYLQIYFAGITATMVYNFGSAILRAVGDTKRPLIFLAISGVINVFFNIIFVVVFQMSVEGVAIATVISQTVAAIMVLWYLAKQKNALRLSFKKLKIQKKKLLDILKLGIPAGVQSTMFSISNIIIQSSINGFGAVVVNGHAAASSIEGFVYAPMNAFHHASLSFTAQNIGAGQNKRINKAVFLSPLCATIIGLFLGLLAYTLATPLLGLYITEPDPILQSQTILYGIERMGTVCVLYFMCGMMDALSGIARGAGYSLTPTLINMIGVCGIRMLWIFTVFADPAYHTINTLLFSYPLTWGLVIVALIVFYLTVVRHGVKRQCEQNLQFSHK